jgi:hypothetical protein
MRSQGEVRITSVTFDNFKALEQFALSLDDVNILVGPNNSGKSTIIGAFRSLDSAIRFARTRAPTRVYVGQGYRIGYRVPEASLPISLENVHTNYNSSESSVSFRINNGNRLNLIFPDDGGCVLIPEAQGADVMTAAAFKRNFPINLTVVPVLGPVEHRETRRERETVAAGLSTHRASRHFRSYWYYRRERFEEFSQLVAATWPGMEIGPPELDPASNELSMFCLEERLTRELYWVGFGFQIWCQLLTHLLRSRNSSIVVIDEPEIYLHPDVQRQLLGIIRDSGSAILLATHSSEIMAEADPTEIILVDKRKRAGERLRDVSGVQRALNIVGSAQNITLTALARSRRVVFVEGDRDFRLLRRFARKLGHRELSAGLGLTPLESGGFGSWERITTLAAGIAEALGSPLIIAAVYDRDYFCDEHIDTVKAALERSLQFAHVHHRKEMENYLLVPGALNRALSQAVAERSARTNSASPRLMDLTDLLREITDPLKDDIQAQLMARRWEHLRGGRQDLADVNRETMRRFGRAWDDLSLRLEIVPGKEVLAQLRGRVQTLYGVSLTDNRIIDAIRREEVPDDLAALVAALDGFRRRTVRGERPFQ